jgi:hypothetical protein
LFDLAFSQKNPGGSGILSTAFNLALPKPYAVSMVWTLNARRTIRATHNSHNGLTTTSNEISGARSRPRRQGDIEFGAIHVVTQTETHVDVSIFLALWSEIPADWGVWCRSAICSIPPTTTEVMSNAIRSQRAVMTTRSSTEQSEEIGICVILWNFAFNRI